MRELRDGQPGQSGPLHLQVICDLVKGLRISSKPPKQIRRNYQAHRSLGHRQVSTGGARPLGHDTDAQPDLRQGQRHAERPHRTVDTWPVDRLRRSNARGRSAPLPARGVARWAEGRRHEEPFGVAFPRCTASPTRSWSLSASSTRCCAPSARLAQREELSEGVSPGSCNAAPSPEPARVRLCSTVPRAIAFLQRP